MPATTIQRSLALLAVCICAANARGAAPQFERFTPVTDGMIEHPAPGDWLLWRRTQNAWGFSPLAQIDARNVGQLALVWTRPLGSGIQEATPLVHDGVMFIPNPDDLVQAVDAENGELLWEHRRPQPDDLKNYIGTPAINRNLAIYGTTIFDLTGDDYIVGLDARTGRLAWETQISDYRKLPAQQSSGPIIARGKVISGRGCQPKVGPEACAMTAHDPATGKELWRALTIARPGEPGDASWGDVPFAQRSQVGTWMVPSYDPALGLVYFGTSVTSPTPKYLLGGADQQHLYHNSTLALDVESGKLRWYYQHVIDHWDLDHAFERILVDTVLAPDPSEVPWINPRIERGEKRKVVTGIPGKTGIVYTLDRETGEFLWARPTVEQNIVSGIDGATGRVTVNPEVVFSESRQTVRICPSFGGGRNFTAGSYSPLTHAMYMPLFNTCAEESVALQGEGLAALLGIRHDMRPVAPDHDIGTLQAISVETGKTLWRYDQRAAITSVLATGGGLIFAGDTAGRMRAFDQRSGKILWEVNLGSIVSGYPIAFAVDGRQYLAVSTGFTLNTALMNRLAPELRPGTASNLFVFALPAGSRTVAGTGVVRLKAESGAANAPPAPVRASMSGKVSGNVWDGVYSQEQARDGLALYQQHCAACHGQSMGGVPGIPAVAGPAFLAGWEGRNTAELFDYLVTTMPPNQIGSIDDRQMADVLAALLQGNHFPSGKQRLDAISARDRPRLISREPASPRATR